MSPVSYHIETTIVIYIYINVVPVGVKFDALASSEE
jgi:hypothetical protein